MPPGLAEPLQAPRLSLFRCWITSKHVLVHYITNCGYFSLIFLFNMAVFGVVTWKSCYLQGMGAAQGGHKAWKVALVAVGLFCLLGATWALAFFTYSTSSAPILYLFTILNSLQGEGSGLGFLGLGREDGGGWSQPGGGLTWGPKAPAPSQHCNALPSGSGSQPPAWSLSWLPTTSTPPRVVCLQGSHSLAEEQGRYPPRAHLKHGEPLLWEGREWGKSLEAAGKRQQHPGRMLPTASCCC